MNLKSMGLLTPREISSMYLIAELSVFRAIRKHGLKQYAIPNRGIFVSKRDFEEFKRLKPELFSKWNRDYCTNQGLTRYKLDN